MADREASTAVIGRDALDRTGEPVGVVEEVYLDDSTGRPKWIACRIAGRDDVALAPAAGVDLERSPLQLAVTRDEILESPAVQVADKHVSVEQDAMLDRHYAPPVDTATDVAASDAPPEVIRSEEELSIATRRVARERVRLVKRVITETVTRTVEVRREELHIERTPLQEPADDGGSPGPPEDAPEADAPASRPQRIAQAVSARLPAQVRDRAEALQRRARERLLGEAFADEETEITLLQEEVVVSKRVVPRERIRLHKEIVTEQRSVTDDLRKEQVELLRDSQPEVPGQ